MADSSKKRIFRRPSLRLANLFLVVLVIFAFTFCLLLYAGMVSTRKSLEVLEDSQLVPPDMLTELKEKYQRDRTLDLVLILISASMGVTLFVYYRYLVRVSRTLREVQSIDHDILNSITRGIITVDLQGMITSCNRAVEQILAVKSEKLIARSLEEAFPSEDPLYQLLKESIREEARPQDRDLAYTAKSGTIMSLRVTTFALQNEVGKRVGGILLVKDMTEIQKMEERAQRHSRLAALGQLTQRLVHEIRNPLSAMDINLQLLQERLTVGGEDSETGRYLEIISIETRRLNEVLRNAQLFSKPEPPDLETVDLHQIIRQVLFLIKEEAVRRQVEIVDNLQAKQILVRADSDQMKQVFINLFKNSIEAMAEGGKLEILSRNDGDDEIIGVELVDTGGGIPMAKLQRVFDPYFTTKKKGTGLGLSIVHNIITQHGGSIDVSSWLGDGTIFRIILPLAPGKEAP
jgi:PAS domain S-box-containing protein